MYERENFVLSTPQSSESDSGGIERYGNVIKGLVKAGAFSTGILIFSTQLDLLSEFGRFVQLGESDETDFRLLVAIVEFLNDVFFSAAAICTWRIFHAGFMSNPDNRSKRF